MWAGPWKYKEGLTIGAGLVITGALLQASVGRVEWGVISSPVNYLLLAVYLVSLVAAHILRKRVLLFSWLGTTFSAATSLGWSALLTVLLGLIRQIPSQNGYSGFPGLDQMLSNWSFVLVYTWMVTSLGLVILRVCIPLKLRRIPFLLNHLGLFIALLCAVLGNADLQRLKMYTKVGAPEWRAFDEMGNMVELPIAVELKQFSIEEYPPKLIVANNESGNALPEGRPENLVVEPQLVETINGWRVEVLKYLPESAPVFADMTCMGMSYSTACEGASNSGVRYNEFHSTGACSSALVRATGLGDNADTSIEGWVSCGSYAFPMKTLKLSEKESLVMPERDPKRYLSAVEIYTESGKHVSDTIQVNKPFRIDGYKVYQLDYDKMLGRWSEQSVFEIVSDPWMPAVYVGIWMLVAGACCMFVQFGRKKEERI